MAEDQGQRTEKPTARRLKEARERGQIARSRDLSGALSLGAVALLLGWLGTNVWSTLGNGLADSLRTMGDRARTPVDGLGLATAMSSDAWMLVTMVGPFALAASVISIGASVAQVGGWQVSSKAIRFDWTRVSFATGLARFRPIQSGLELVKSLLGLSVIGALCYEYVRGVFDDAPRLAYMMPAAAASTGWSHVWTLLWQASLALVALGGADYGIQRARWSSGVKMTRQEVKDDNKMQDGNPEIKARVRRVQREMTKRRMLHAVKTATVVVVNPTHVSVALSYERHTMAAPVLVAKGYDEMAGRIRKIAREAGVPIVENVTLARALAKTTEVGEAIPADLFGAVAEVLAYLVRLKQLML